MSLQLEQSSLDRPSSGGCALFDALFLEHHDRIHRIVFRIVGNHQEAEDLTQETFMRLYDYMEHIDPQRAHHWLHRVAVNFGLKAIRGRKRYQNWKRRAKEEYQNNPLPEHPDPLAAARVRQVLSELPERQAQLLLLHTAGFTYEELAEATQIKRSSVSQLLSRARSAFERTYRSLEREHRQEKAHLYNMKTEQSNER